MSNTIDLFEDLINRYTVAKERNAGLGCSNLERIISLEYSRIFRENNNRSLKKIIDSNLEKVFPSTIPEIGNDFIGYKIVTVQFDDNLFTADMVYVSPRIYMGLAKLYIPKEARRLQSFNGKCRCDRVKTLEIRLRKGKETIFAKRGYSSVASSLNSRIYYYVDEMTVPDMYDDNRWMECSNGIHFFMTPKEAADFACRNNKINVIIPNGESYDIKQALEGLFEEGE